MAGDGEMEHERLDSEECVHSLGDVDGLMGVIQTFLQMMPGSGGAHP